MTPRHLAIFCIAQLACIAGGLLCIIQSRKWFAMFRQALGDYARPFPGYYEFLIQYGWMLVAIPVACVLLIPRHREDDCCVGEDWRVPAKVAAVLGIFAAASMGLIGFYAIMSIRTG